MLSALIYAVAYGVTRISSVGSLLGVLSFPVGLYLTGARLTGPRLPSYVLTAVLLVFILVRHRGNIQRLLQHKEQRV